MEEFEFTWQSSPTLSAVKRFVSLIVSSLINSRNTLGIPKDISGWLRQKLYYLFNSMENYSMELTCVFNSLE